VEAKVMLRSLVLKLTLAFLLVGLIGAGLVAVFVRWRTQTAFNRLVLDQNQQELVANLTLYYKNNGSWVGVERAFTPGTDLPLPPRETLPQAEARRSLFTITDQGGRVVFGGPPGFAGHELSKADLKTGIPIAVDNNIVGWLLFTPRLDRWRPGTPEGDFLVSVNSAILLSALVAVLLALIIGGLLAATLTRSLRELTAATKEVAHGQLGLQVQVRSKDELGDLAQSFNQMSSELARSNQLRRQMSADIAHDLRNPLSVIMGYSEALADGKLQPSSEMFEVLHSEVMLLSRLIDDFKTLTLADAGDLPMVFQQINPEILLKRISNSYSVQAQNKSIILRIDVSSELPEVRVDVERMLQVLGNLVSNALRYTDENGTITISANSGDGEVQITVSDNGMGIPSDDLPYVFERSFRGDRARHQQNGEAGLGLAIAKSIVEANGGSITVDSELGKGTKFTITLPSVLDNI
jgi:signal transduction histidine kinase